jgi:predicted transglutaminase-like cysteine proteinase
VLKAVMPAVQHPNQDVRNASGKILLDVHKMSGCVTAEELQDLNDKAKSVLLEKLAGVQIEKNLNTTNARVNQQVKAIEEEEDGEDTDQAEVPETIST